MKKPSAGILLYKVVDGVIEVLLAHPGGPYWTKRDLGAWSIPKGRFEEGEDALAAAKREFTEETGQVLPDSALVDLGLITRIDGKVIHAWAAEGDADLSIFRSNLFEMEWPPKSGRMQQFPEVDRIAWVPLSEAPAKMHRGQAELIKRLAAYLGAANEPASAD